MKTERSIRGERHEKKRRKAGLCGKKTGGVVILWIMVCPAGELTLNYVPNYGKEKKNILREINK